VLVEDVAALGVDVDEVEGSGAAGELSFDTAEEVLEDGCFEGVVEEGESGCVGKIEGESVLLMEDDGSDWWGGGVGGVGGLPDLDVALGDVGHLGIEFDAADSVKGRLAGDEHGAAFAGADVEEGVAVDGVGRDGLAPVVDEGAEDAGGYTVVGGDEGVVGVAGDEVAGGDKAAGVDVVDLVERMDGCCGELEEILGAFGHGLADLDEVGVAVEAEGAAASGGNLLRAPCGLIEESDLRVAYGLDACEAVGDLGAELGFGGLGCVRGSDLDFDDVLLRDAWDVGAGGLRIA
jgi:hypothetical protein